MFNIILTAIIATGSMTLFMTICGLIAGSPLFPVRILAVMIGRLLQTGTRKPEDFIFLLMANLLHYLIGIGFVAVYYVYKSTKIDPLLVSPFEPWVFGILLGIVAVVGWGLFVRMHPAPPTKVAWPTYLLCIFGGHLVFAVVTEVCYRSLYSAYA